MLRYVAVAAALAIGATAVYAQNLEAIKARRDAMGAIAVAGTANFKMLKGEAPFDLAKVQTGLKTMQDAAAKFKDLFPDNSKTGGDTDAMPKIWQSKPQFEAEIAKFAATVTAATTSIKDEASFKAEYQNVARSCGGCHMENDGFSPRLGVSLKKLKQ